MLISSSNSILWGLNKKVNQSVNDTEAPPQLGRVVHELKFVKSVRQFYAQAQAPSSKLNKIEIG